MLGKPIAQLKQTVSQSIPNTTWTMVTFTTEDIDRDNGHSTTTNTSRYVVQTPGWYMLSGRVAFPNNGSGIRYVGWWVNGTEISTLTFPALAGPANLPAETRLVYLNINDYVELGCYQNSGGALSLGNSTAEYSSMTLVWVSL